MLRVVGEVAGPDRSFVIKMRTSALVVLTAWVISTTANAAGADWYDTAWKSRQKITVASGNVSGSHTDFPLLVSAGGNNPVFFGAKPDGADILFTASDAVTPVPFEKEKYDPVLRELVYWVKVDSLADSQDTCVYMYYNSAGTAPANTPSEVWTNAFVMVQHMQENADDASPAFKDSTPNGNDGTDFAGMAASNRVAGQIGDAQEFNGVDVTGHRIEVPSNTTLDITGAMTISAWCKGTPFNDGIISKIDTSVNFGYRLVDESGSSPTEAYECRFNDGTNHAARGTTAADLDIWQHVVAVFVPSSAVRLYVNGSLETQNTTSIPASIGSAATIPLFIGARHSGANPAFNYDGIIDEVRISAVARNAGWIETAYSNQVAPKAFLAFDPEENRPTQWFHPAWLKRQKIMISSNKVTGTLLNFPFLVRITTNNAVFTRAKADGGDIVFTKANGETRIPYEREKYDPTATQLVYWVRLNVFPDAQDTCIYMYYGSSSNDFGNVATDVWSNDYVLVQHLQESPAGAGPQMIDSTFYANSGSSSGAMSSADQVMGQIDGSLDFDGSDDRIVVPHSSSLNITGAFTLSGWFKADTNMFNDGLIDKLGGISGKEGYRVVMDGDRLEFRVGDGDTIKNAVGSTTGLNDNAWHHLAGVFTPSASATLYLDAVQDGQETAAIPASTFSTNDMPLSLGARTGLAAFRWTGLLDELRVAKVARDLDWITTSYSNQLAPASCFSLGAEETNPSNLGSILSVH